MLRNRKGQGLVEYVLIIVLVVVIAIIAVKTFGSKVNQLFTQSNEKIASEVQVDR